MIENPFLEFKYNQVHYFKAIIMQKDVHLLQNSGILDY
jgi:hypothetical protein